MSPTSREHTLVASVIGAAAAAAAFAAASAHAQEPSVSQVEEVVVTGSRIRRTDSDTAEPVSVIGAQDLIERGFVNVADALNDLPQVRLSDAGRGRQSGSTVGRNFINLFALGSQRTLTLVNGSRFVGSNPAGAGDAFRTDIGGTQVDMNTLPTGLIDRIEVVEATGGAVYGSDAVAGVVNVILKKNFQGLEVDLQGGVAEPGDYDSYSGRVTFGRNFLDSRANLAANLELSRTGSLTAIDRAATRANIALVTNPGNTSNADGIPAQILIDNFTFSVMSEGGLPFLVNSPVISQQVRNSAGQPVQFAPNGDLVPFNVGTVYNVPFAQNGDGARTQYYTTLVTPVERLNLTLLGRLDLTDNVRLSTELLASDLKTREPLNALTGNHVTGSGGRSALAFGVDNAFLTPQARSVLAGAGASTFYLSRWNTDITPELATRSEGDTYRGLLRMEGDFSLDGRDMYWSAVASRGSTSGMFSRFDTNYTRLRYAVDAVSAPTGEAACRVTLNNPTSTDPDIANCRPLNLFGVGAPGQEARDYVSAVFRTDFELDQTNYQLNLGGELIELPAGAVSAGIGWERRQEESDFAPNANMRLGLNGVAPIVAVRGAYSTNEFYGELRVPLLGKGFTVPLIDSAELTGSYRTVDNSLAGRNEAWAVGARINLLRDVTLRGTKSGTFRAPNLYELFLPRSQQNTTGADPCDARFIDTGQVPAIRRANCEAEFAQLGLPASFALNSTVVNIQLPVFTGGSTSLENETADSWTLGVVYQPRFAPGLTLTADWVQIDLTDAITNFTLANAFQACYDNPNQNAFCGMFRRLPSGQIEGGTAQLGFTNSGFLKFAARNFGIDWQAPLDRLFGDRGGTLNLATNVVQTRRFRQSASGLVFDELELAGTTRYPEWEAQLAVRYRNGPLNLAWTTNFMSGTRFNYTDTIENRSPLHVAHYTTHDFSAMYGFTDRLRARFIVNNVTDTEIPYGGITGNVYGPTYDFIGRMYNLGLSYRF